MTTTDIVESMRQTAEIAAVAYVTSGDQRFCAIAENLHYLIGRLDEDERIAAGERAIRHYVAMLDQLLAEADAAGVEEVPA